ncbi:MAG: thymidine phosphorylase [Acidobacteria bacterium]|jgi:pyrimidine-nucleoside phosphorylase|nr:thymidine phosphorylase [Acidobacteriota bacterium]
MANGMYEIISKKRDGLELGREEIAFVIDGYVKGDIPDYQVAAWLMAIYIRGLNDRELADLTGIMLDSGDRIALDAVPGKKIDKHSTGGVGDKISFIVAPLVAACGVRVPMLSGRGLGHTGGTLDKLEAIPGMNVFLQPEQFRRVLAGTGMVICGQTDNIVPADKKIYALRDATATVSSIPLIASSIMSKKLALGSDGIVLDVKTGSGAFMREEADSIRLCRTMVAIGEKTGRPCLGIISNMDQPLGRAVGNSLEMIESFEALKGRGPADVMEVTYALGWCMLRAAGEDISYTAAETKFTEAIASGRALEVLRRFIAAQGGDPRACDDYSLLPASRHQEEFASPASGHVERIDSFEVGMAAIDTGAGRRRKEDAVAHGAGFIFHANVGDAVKKGQPLLTIHSDRPDALPAVRERLLAAIGIGARTVAKPKMILHLVDRNGVIPWPH